MKKKLFLIIGMALLVLTLLIPVGAFAATTSEVDSAQKAAQAWLDTTAAINPELPQWKGALVTHPQPFHSLEGEVNTYLFSITGKSGVVGHILVGSALYDYNVLQAGAVAPPAIPAPNVVKAAVERLGFKVDKDKIGPPVDRLYTGVDGVYAVYQIDNQKVAVNLIYKNAVLVTNLKCSMPSPQEYQEAKKSTRESRLKSILSSGFNYLPMSYWNGQGRGWCGPCSGVSIGAYYRGYQGYSSLLSPNETMYDYLYYSMHTYDYGGATMPWDYGPGFVDMAEYCGYNNFTYSNDWTVTHNDYWNVVSDIDSGWPTALCIGEEFHWRAIKGYSYDTDYDYYYIICTNSQTSDSWEYLDWDNLGLGLFTCAIED